MVRLVERAALAATAELKGLGPEPLSREFNADYLAEKARGRTAAIKNLMMDQRIVAGVGNIYASEILFRAGVRPTRRAGRVTRGEIEKIAAAVPSSCAPPLAAMALRFAAIAIRADSPAIRRALARVRPRGKTVLLLLDADQKCGRRPAREFLLPEVSALRRDFRSDDHRLEICFAATFIAVCDRSRFWRFRTAGRSPRLRRN